MERGNAGSAEGRGIVVVWADADLRDGHGDREPEGRALVHLRLHHDVAWGATDRPTGGNDTCGV